MIVVGKTCSICNICNSHLCLGKQSLGMAYPLITDILCQTAAQIVHGQLIDLRTSDTKCIAYAELLESDLSMYSSVMYDASALPMEENIEKTRDYVRRKGHQLLIEGACDEIVDATGEVRCEITDADKCEYYMKQTGVDVVVANLGTEHRASGQDLHYYSDAAKAIKARIGPRICLHGTSSVSNDQIAKLFDDGICKVNIWTALERDASPALTEWTVKNIARCGGPKLEQKLVEVGYLTSASRTGEKSSLQHFTTTARQEIIFEEMKKIVRGYLDLWYV